jgi:hypothetical protein
MYFFLAFKLINKLDREILRNLFWVTRLSVPLAYHVRYVNLVHLINGVKTWCNIAACEDHPLTTMTSFLMSKQPLQGAALT